MFVNKRRIVEPPVQLCTPIYNVYKTYIYTPNINHQI